VRHQAFEYAAGGFSGNQRNEILHEVFGAISRHFRRTARCPEASQKWRHATVAAIFGARKMQQQSVPDEGAFRKTVQKNQGRPPRNAAHAALQGDAVRQVDGF
jgi:hypothetical protein